MIERVEEQLKILMVNSTFGVVGGVERFIISMGEMLKQENWQVYGLFEREQNPHPRFTAVFDDWEIIDKTDISEQLDYYQEIGINVVCIHKVAHHAWVKELQKLFPTVLIVHDHDYYCLRRHKYFPIQRRNCHLPFSQLYCPLCAGIIERKDKGYGLIDWEARYLMLKQIRQCEMSFVLSEYMKANLIQNAWDKDKIHLLKPLQAMYPIQQNANAIPQILYVGQLIRGKGVDLLLKALTHIHLNYRCKIVGRGNDEQYLKELIAQFGLSKKVEIAGWSDSIDDEYIKSDLVVVPSRWQEPFALIGLEAFAHAKPVVAFDVGGISQWLRHKQNGILVKAKDSKRLASAIKKLLQNPSLRDEYGRAGYAMVKRENNYEKFRESFLMPLQELARK